MTTVIQEATTCGFSEATLRRAREELKVRMYRDEGGPFSVGWWTLRPMEATGDGACDAVDTSAIQNWDPRPTGRKVSARGGAETAGQAEKADLCDEDSESGADRSSDGGWDPLQERLLAAILGSVMESGEAEDVLPGNGHSACNGKHESNGHHESNGDRPKPE